MYLTRHQILGGARWALDGRWLPPGLALSHLLEVPARAMYDLLRSLAAGEVADGPLLAPIDPPQEVWASGVTYQRSRQARMAESQASAFYDKVYEAERPELFFKAAGWRVAGPGAPVRVRADSGWNVPEPEMTLVFNRDLAIVGYCAGNDMSSRDIEGANPLYLPQAKIYDGACALGPGLRLAPDGLPAELPIQLDIARGGVDVFHGATSTASLKRRPDELVVWLGRELAFPQGGFLMTGTGIVPGEDFSLQSGDSLRVAVGELVLENRVA
jgi:2-dehydro-3-deoxy-D-arabinonate dehydratase